MFVPFVLLRSAVREKKHWRFQWQAMDAIAEMSSEVLVLWEIRWSFLPKMGGNGGIHWDFRDF